MLQAGARLCKCLGEEFLPYLGLVMPPLLAAAQLKPDVHVSDAGSDADEDDDDEEVTSQAGHLGSNSNHVDTLVPTWSVKLSWLVASFAYLQCQQRC